MFKKIAYVFVIVFAVYALSACGKKKQAEEEGAAGTGATEQAATEVNPNEMVLIPAGEFTLGTNDKESNAYPEQKINLPAFWIDKYEATNSQFLDFAMKTHYTGEGAKEGKDWRVFFTPDKGDFPVIYITWNDAEAYCKSLGKRLPTEEEWEKAARGTDGRRFPWGNDWAMDRSNTYEAGTSNKAVAVGEYEDASPYGVRDMLGNVQEWTSSWYATYKGNPKKDPSSGQRYRVVRGQSSHYVGKASHVYDRAAWAPGILYDFGCRCAKNATPEEAAKAATAK